MHDIVFLSLLSILFVSLLSFVGIIELFFKEKKLKKILIYFVGFAAGAMLGDVFFHLIPSLFDGEGFNTKFSFFILGGILLFFVMEKSLSWRHCHELPGKEEVLPFAYTNLIGDGIHNFIDGMIIASSYLTSLSVGIATTLAVVLHEIPQEIGDFGVLLHSGLSKTRALFLNFFSALFAFLGGLFVLFFYQFSKGATGFIISIAIGGFVYVAGSDLIPELHKNNRFEKSLIEILAFLIGLALMGVLLLIE